MNAQLQPRRVVDDEPIFRSSARVSTAVQADAQFPQALAEDRSTENRSTPATQPHRVNPLWMITWAGAAMFVCLMAAVTFS
jgi:hypothetical protein